MRFDTPRFSFVTHPRVLLLLIASHVLLVRRYPNRRDASFAKLDNATITRQLRLAPHRCETNERDGLASEDEAKGLKSPTCLCTKLRMMTELREQPQPATSRTMARGSGHRIEEVHDRQACPWTQHVAVAPSLGIRWTWQGRRLTTCSSISCLGGRSLQDPWPPRPCGRLALCLVESSLLLSHPNACTVAKRAAGC